MIYTLQPCMIVSCSAACVAITSERSMLIICSKTYRMYNAVSSSPPVKRNAHSTQSRMCPCWNSKHPRTAARTKTIVYSCIVNSLLKDVHPKNMDSGGAVRLRVEDHCLCVFNAHTNRTRRPIPTADDEEEENRHHFSNSSSPPSIRRCGSRRSHSGARTTSG